MTRITVRDVDGACNRLNTLAGFAKGTALWTRQEDGRNRATVGMYYVDGAYGGYALHRMMNESGGVDDVFRSGHVPARDLYNRIWAFIEGMEYASRPESEVYAKGFRTGYYVARNTPAEDESEPADEAIRFHMDADLVGSHD